MSATERLLEVIYQTADDLSRRATSDYLPLIEPRQRLQEIVDAARELRRRGDTFVRRDDLITALSYVLVDVDNAAAVGRLENALYESIT